MKNLASTLSLLLFISMVANAQSAEDESYYFQKTPINVESVNTDMVRNHYLGDDIAKKMHLFKSTYTYIQEANGINPVDKTIVEKPAIYYSINKLNAYYKKGLNKGYMSQDEAREKLNQYLTICLTVYNQRTELLESALRKSKTQPEIEGVFAKVVIFGN